MPPDLDEARLLNEEAIAFDLHADTPKLMDVFDLDVSRRHEPPLPGARFLGHVDLPRMREGGLCAQFFGLWTFPYPQRGCAASVHRQLDALDRAITRHPDELAFCRSAEDVLAARASGRIAALAGIEGAHALEGRLERVEEFARRGVRYLGLLHFTANQAGAPAMGIGGDADRGLTDFGRALVAELERCGVIVDLAHINRRGFFDALAAGRASPIVSHTGVSGVREHWRNIDDDQLRAVAERGGVIGVIFGPKYLGGPGIDAVVDHLLHVIDVAGEDAPALGSDFDGMLKPPRGLEDVSALPRLTAALRARGLARETVRKLLGGNALRVLGQVPPAFSSPPAA